jgi:hypothetical protein
LNFRQDTDKLEWVIRRVVANYWGE